MDYENTSHKFVIVLDRSRPSGTLLNATAHLCLGLGVDLGPDAAGLSYDAPVLGISSTISAHPVIILEARSSAQLLNLVDRAKRCDQLRCTLFATSMLGASAEDQLQRTRALTPGTTELIAVGLFGPRTDIDPVVRKFSLFKSAQTHDVSVA